MPFLAQALITRPKVLMKVYDLVPTSWISYTITSMPSSICWEGSRYAPYIECTGRPVRASRESETLSPA